MNLPYFEGWRALGPDEPMDKDDPLVYIGDPETVYSTNSLNPETTNSRVMESRHGLTYNNARGGCINHKYYPYRKGKQKLKPNPYYSTPLPLP